jgi:cellulose synthase/poly-beta-1,6-N-acetylglucosamine synthase-like glycosyltransferase
LTASWIQNSFLSVKNRIYRIGQDKIKGSFLSLPEKNFIDDYVIKRYVKQIARLRTSMTPLPITDLTTTGFYFSSFMFLASAFLLMALYKVRWKSDAFSLCVWFFVACAAMFATGFVTGKFLGASLAFCANLLLVLLLQRLATTISLFGVFFLASLLLPAMYGLIWMCEVASEVSGYFQTGKPLFLTVLALFTIFVIFNAVMLSWIVLVRYSPLYFRFPRVSTSWEKACLPKNPVPFPCISIHVPCFNEPPEMLIETLNAIAHLQYPNFEVIVLDNNTKDPKIWKPVEEHCEKLGERFCFFHIDSLAGAKAGALNACLARTSKQAEFIAVLDADYVVRPDFLEKLIGFFNDPKIGFVQACQDFRAWKQNAYMSACNYEYETHFKLELSGQNEWDVNYTIGTMCLIRRDVLEKVGGWAEWCLTEDSEVAVRIHALGYSGQYLKDSFGQGLIPETFEGYKQQRFRWTAGPVQQFQKHWPLYLPWSSQGKLSLVQKFGEIFHSLSIFFSESLSLLINIPVLGICLWLATSKETAFTVPTPVLLFIPAVVTRNILCNWLSVRLLGGTWRNYVYSAIAARSLYFVRNKAFYMAWTTKDLKWKRTNKFKSEKSLWKALHSSTEELIALFITVVFAAIIASFANFREPDVIFLIWLGILNQAVSFACAPIMACLDYASKQRGFCL